MGAGRCSGASNLTDLLALLDRLTFGNADLTCMSIEGNETVAVRDHAVVAVTGATRVLSLNGSAYIDDRTAGSCTDG